MSKTRFISFLGLVLVASAVLYWYNPRWEELPSVQQNEFNRWVDTVEQELSQIDEADQGPKISIKLKMDQSAVQHQWHFNSHAPTSSPSKTVGLLRLVVAGQFFQQKSIDIENIYRKNKSIELAQLSISSDSRNFAITLPATYYRETLQAKLLIKLLDLYAITTTQTTRETI